MYTKHCKYRYPAYLCVVLGLHGAFYSEQFLHGILIAVQHLEVLPLVPEFLGDSGVADLAAVGVDLSGPVYLPEGPLGVRKTEAHFSGTVVRQFLDGFLKIKLRINKRISVNTNISKTKKNFSCFRFNS